MVYQLGPSNTYLLSLSVLPNLSVCTILSFQDRRARLSSLTPALRFIYMLFRFYIFTFYKPSGTRQSFSPQAPCSELLEQYCVPVFGTPFHNSQSQSYSATLGSYREFFSNPQVVDTGMLGCMDHCSSS
jgi:hypothetical protein